MEVTNRFKGLDGIDKVPEKLWLEVCNTVQEAVIKSSPRKGSTRRFENRILQFKTPNLHCANDIKVCIFLFLEHCQCLSLITFWRDEIVSRRKNIILKEKVKVLVAQWCLTL